MEIVVISESQYLQGKNFRKLDQQAKGFKTRECSVSSIEVKASMAETSKYKRSWQEIEFGQTEHIMLRKDFGFYSKDKGKSVVYFEFHLLGHPRDYHLDHAWHGIMVAPQQPPCVPPHTSHPPSRPLSCLLPRGSFCLFCIEGSHIVVLFCVWLLSINRGPGRSGDTVGCSWAHSFHHCGLFH